VSEGPIDRETFTCSDPETNGPNDTDTMAHHADLELEKAIEDRLHALSAFVVGFSIRL
jgi:hypothetical protein